MPRHLTARSQAGLWLLLVLLVLPLVGVSASAQSQRDGRPSVTVFVDPNFRGTSETFAGDIADLREFGLNDEISSIDIRPGEAWEVCRDINFENQCQVLTRSVSDLGALGWDDGVSSMRRVRGQAGPSRDVGNRRRQGLLETEYRGTSETLFDDATDLRESRAERSNLEHRHSAGGFGRYVRTITLRTDARS